MQLKQNYTCADLIKIGEHFFDLRDKTNVDPQMYDLAHPLHEEFNKIKHEKISEQERETENG